ncbi:MAG: TRAFs-binding domain-containing protein [Bryobacteraceae bacterium]
MTSTEKKTCFVIMGFGEKTDYQTGRLLNLDKSYKNIIKPAVEAAGLECVRADEIRHSGVIDTPMYEWLLKADVVVADLSTYNSNAIYELGVRHALRPYTTITIAENQLKYPFDLNHIVIRSYEHLGKDIGYDEATRMRAELEQAIRTILAKPAPDSPIYTYIKNLSPPQVQEAAKSMAAETNTRGETENPVAGSGPRISFLIEEAALAKEKEDWVRAREYFGRVRQLMRDPKGQRPEDHYVVQQLALATYKSKQPDPASALREARDLLLTLEPEKTHDPETLGLLGAVWKRLYELDPSNQEALDSAISSYEHGFYLKNDYYNGINLAYLLNLRASLSSDDEAVADEVLARRVRRKVLKICERIDYSKLPSDEQYWILATIEEAQFGLGDMDAYENVKAMAAALGPASWMLASTKEQIDKLQKLLEGKR